MVVMVGMGWEERKMTVQVGHRKLVAELAAVVHQKALAPGVRPRRKRWMVVGIRQLLVVVFESRR